MPNSYDIAYAVGLAAAAPFWLIAPKPRRKVLRALRERMGRGQPMAPAGGTFPAVLIHAVSLGEINATRAMLQALQSARPDLRFVITVTTDTGFARGKELYGSNPRVAVIRYPLDFSSAIARVLDSWQPRAAVLMELEVWPNFVLHCHRRNIPVLLVNGRLTRGSFRGYLRIRSLVAPTFGRLSAVCAQDQEYADRFLALGAWPDRVQVTGTMKFDTAQIAEQIDGQEEVASSLGLDSDAPVWVCGSTGPGEEEILLRCHRDLQKMHPKLRLVIVPRHPERFDEVAGLIERSGNAVLRRSRQRGSRFEIRESPSPVILGDTMGELRKFYSLATLVFVGRSLVDLGPRQHGSDMIEPAALGKPVVVGPWTHNFADAMARFREADAVKVVGLEAELHSAIGDLLAHPDRAAEMGQRAKQVVVASQGATARHVQLILKYLE